MTILIAVIWGGISWVDFYYFPEFTWRQRMTVQVVVDGEIVSGSSVIENRVRLSPSWDISQHSRHPSLVGEAVAVDLGERGYLFALLRSETSVDHPKSLALRRYPEIFHDARGRLLPTSDPFDSPYHVLQRQRDTREIPRDDYPMLVTFTDINDPKSVQLVDPDDLAATFGAGVSLKRITLEITGDPVTEKIAILMPWFEDYRQNQYRLDGAKCVVCRDSLDDLPSLLGPANFKAGE